MMTIRCSKGHEFAPDFVCPHCSAEQEAVAWVPPSFFDKGVVAATARRKPPSETAVAMRGEYVPLYAAPVTAAPAAEQLAPNTKPTPAFYLSENAWAHIRVPMTPTRSVITYRHGFDHGDIALVPFYAAPPITHAAYLQRIAELSERIMKYTRFNILGTNAANIHSMAHQIAETVKRMQT